MPVLDEATYSSRRAGSLPAAVSSSNGPSVNLPNGFSTPAAPLVDLLDLSSDDVPAPSTSGGGDFLHDLLGVDLSPAQSQSGTSQNQKSGTDALLDLLSIGGPPATNNSSNPDILSLSLESQNSGAPLETLSSLSSMPAQVSSPSAAAPVVDLLDGLSSSQPTPDVNGS